jgi:hypothetical protein
MEEAMGLYLILKMGKYAHYIKAKAEECPSDWYGETYPGKLPANFTGCR